MCSVSIIHTCFILASHHELLSSSKAESFYHLRLWIRRTSLSAIGRQPYGKQSCVPLHAIMAVYGLSVARVEGALTKASLWRVLGPVVSEQDQTDVGP